MTRSLPQIHEGRDGVTAVIKLLNELRRNVRGPTKTIVPCGSLSLLTSGQTPFIPANAFGWVTTGGYVVPDIITGAQVGAPLIRIGANATWDNVVNITNLGLALAVDTAVPLTIVTPTVAQANIVYLDVTAGAGPTVLNATF